MDFSNFKSLFSNKGSKDSRADEAAEAAEENDPRPSQTVSAVSEHAEIFKGVSLQQHAPTITPAAGDPLAAPPFTIPENLLAPQHIPASAPGQPVPVAPAAPYQEVPATPEQTVPAQAAVPGQPPASIQNPSPDLQSAEAPAPEQTGYDFAPKYHDYAPESADLQSQPQLQPLSQAQIQPQAQTQPLTPPQSQSQPLQSGIDTAAALAAQPPLQPDQTAQPAPAAPAAEQEVYIGSGDHTGCEYSNSSGTVSPAGTNAGIPDSSVETALSAAAVPTAPAAVITTESTAIFITDPAAVPAVETVAVPEAAPTAGASIPAAAAIPPFQPFAPQGEFNNPLSGRGEFNHPLFGPDPDATVCADPTASGPGSAELTASGVAANAAGAERIPPYGQNADPVDDLVSAETAAFAGRSFLRSTAEEMEMGIPPQQPLQTQYSFAGNTASGNAASAAPAVMQANLQAEREALQRRAQYNAQNEHHSAAEVRVQAREADDTRTALDGLSSQQDKLIRAAQYKPFEVNYESRSPNYDELARERQAREAADKISSFNDKEVLPAGLTIRLYLRQLIAALFSHTTLSVLMPGAAMRFGPCYPSSMAIPYLLTGIIAGLVSASICWYADVKQLTGGLFLTVYVLLTGVTGFRGLAELICYISRRYTDSAIIAATVMLSGTIIIFTVCVVYGGNEPFEGAIFIALASMVSACAASTLCFDIKQDPVDSFGTMSIKGLIFCIVMVTAVCFLTLKVEAACSVVGLSLLLRLILGQYFTRHNILASRPMICAVQLLLLIAVLFDLMFMGIYHNMLNNMIYELLSAGHLIALR